MTPNPEDIQRNETCDDGAENGGPESLCTLQCQDARVVWRALDENTVLPFPARKLVFALPNHLVISNFDDNGMAFVPVGNSGPPQILKKYSAPLDFEVGQFDLSDQAMEVVWIERAVPGVGGPFLLLAKIGDEPHTIQELLYPVSGSVDGTFVEFENVGPNGMVDVAGNGRVQRTRWRSDLSISGFDLGTAPAGRLSLAINLSSLRTKLALFFDDDGKTNVLLADDPPAGPTTREWDGTWPRPVVHATHGRWTLAQSDHQMALLGSDGSIDIFTPGGELGEIVDLRYGSVPPGSQRIHEVGGTVHDNVPPSSIISLDPQGRLVVLINNGEGRSLAPQYLTIGPSCSVCTLAETTGAVEWFALDNLAVHGLALPVASKLTP